MGGAEIRAALIRAIEAGFEVSRDGAGYAKKWEHGSGFLHQTKHRSTHDFPTAAQAIDDFLAELGEEAA